VFVGVLVGVLDGIGVTVRVGVDVETGVRVEVLTGVEVNTSVPVGLPVGCRVGVFLVDSAVDVTAAVPVTSMLVGVLGGMLVRVWVGPPDVAVGKGVLAGRVWVKSWVGAPNRVGELVGEGVTVDTGVCKMTWMVSNRAGISVDSRSLITSEMIPRLIAGSGVDNSFPAL
jgi:hypothetical protein